MARPSGKEIMGGLKREEVAARATLVIILLTGRNEEKIEENGKERNKRNKKNAPGDRRTYGRTDERS